VLTAAHIREQRRRVAERIPAGGRQVALAGVITVLEVKG
jgi:hypothetical protein